MKNGKQTGSGNGAVDGRFLGKGRGSCMKGSCAGAMIGHSSLLRGRVVFLPGETHPHSTVETRVPALEIWATRVAWTSTTKQAESAFAAESPDNQATRTDRHERRLREWRASAGMDRVRRSTAAVWTLDLAASSPGQETGEEVISIRGLECCSKRGKTSGGGAAHQECSVPEF